MGYARNHGLCNCKISFLAFCLLSHILVYTVVNIILIKSGACIYPDCFHQLHCAIYFSVPSVCLEDCLFVCVCVCARVRVKEFNVPAVV